jgi:hypothetical protein
MEIQIIQNKIYTMREQRIMLDFDLAEIYGVPTKRLKEQVKRNIERFPDDFMFELSKEELEFLRSQIVTSKIIDNSKENRGGNRYLPYAFTQEGVAMLSSVLRSPLAIQMNISIMRAFVAIRKCLTSSQTIEERMKALEQANEDLLKDINDLSEDTRNNFDDIYISLAQLAEKQKVINEKANQPRPKIGYIRYDDNE